eukprot:403373368
MKPFRVRMTDEMIRSYGMDKQMKRMEVEPEFIENVDFTVYHSDDYVDVLKNLTLDNRDLYADQINRFNFGEDCPIFDGMYDYCQIYTAGSLRAASWVAQGNSDIGINWAGGLHHAKKMEASGFCYVNDCVMAILEFLKTYERVLYIDIDCHHGDGVEEAFFTTNRVMTASFHKFGDYFPGTGAIDDIGAGPGKHYSMNFPLSEGVDDFTFEQAFKPVMKEIMDRFKPQAIVHQCGTDSLSGDRLGLFNLSVKGHGATVEYMRSFGIPMILVGGGGYSLRNVARCWTYETSVALGIEIDNNIPHHEYSSYFQPDSKIVVPVSNMENNNSRESIEKSTQEILQNLKNVQAVNVDHSYYRNQQGHAPHHLAFDESENRQIKEDKNKDTTPDNQ